VDDVVSALAPGNGGFVVGLCFLAASLHRIQEVGPIDNAVGIVVALDAAADFRCEVRWSHGAHGRGSCSTAMLKQRKRKRRSTVFKNHLIRRASSPSGDTKRAT
jgi:hypothetical protein